MSAHIRVLYSLDRRTVQIYDLDVEERLLPFWRRIVGSLSLSFTQDE
jgi:hypothetical protein